MIDAGADIVAGHGPHLLRGLELYKGKPIFYSLGNFIGQNELVQKIPADGYDRFRADPDLKPGQVYQVRMRNDQAGFPADKRYWESVVPVLTWDGRELRAIELLPISLGWKEPRHKRGRPRLAGKDEGRAVLERFAALSQPFGTTIDVAGANVVIA
jgi:poly-gamma-glutamate synthesis protein (capsule biosynthesis protein)